ncbi:unnamed protein product [Dovyalis caffra]|uniref:Rhodanese domain-containing protein n=1 Tax=Dovyalis caffra TaxID=77055 RepID=A0AAV1RHI2_9ROSI|nr:unnamed protein product [Dovyalis caffra]
MEAYFLLPSKARTVSLVKNSALLRVCVYTDCLRLEPGSTISGHALIMEADCLKALMGIDTLSSIRGAFLLTMVDNANNNVQSGVLLALKGSEVVTIDVKASKGLLESGHIYLDVRTVEEYEKGHVNAENIFNIPYMFNTPEGRVKNPNFLKEVSAVCKEEDHIVVGCQSGVRSLYATADLLSAGFKDVSDMGGGYLAWKENVFPVKIEKEQKVEL